MIIMTQNIKNKTLNNTYELFNAMVKDNLGYIYRGNFNDDIIDSILELTEVSLQSDEQSSKIKKRVYAIMVEGLQNITRHQDASSDIKSDRKSIFVIQKLNEKYFITTGNIVEKQNIDNIKGLIQKINTLNKDELKIYYKKVLEEGMISKKGGAGLGLIDMARKSGNRLSYHFKEISDNLSYFYLHTVPSLEKVNDIKVDGRSSSLDRMVKTHDILNNEEVMMIFNGIFNGESYTNILSSLQKNISEDAVLKNKLTAVISEMLQNIVKHASKLNPEQKGNPGVFYVSRLDESYSITSGNYVKKDEVKGIEDYINKLNLSSKKEIEKEISASINKTNTNIKQGLLDIMHNTKSEINYSFKEAGNNLSFLSLRVELKPE